MTKSKFESLAPGYPVAVRYQYMGRRYAQEGWRSKLVDSEFFIRGIGYVSYKSVDVL